MSRRRSVLGGGGLIVLVAVIAIGVAIVAHNRHPSDAAHDVKVMACVSGKNGAKPVASGQIDNSTTKASSYVVQVRFVDPQGNTLTRAVATVKNVDPHRSAAWTATGATATSGPVSCDLAGVTRTHLPGQ